MPKLSQAQGSFRMILCLSECCFGVYSLRFCFLCFPSEVKRRNWGFRGVSKALGRVQGHWGEFRHVIIVPLNLGKIGGKFGANSHT